MSRSLFLLVGAILLLVIAVVTVPSLVVARDRAAVVWTAALLAAALALTAAASLARNLARPLRELADALRRIGAGDFDARVMPGRRGELRELGRGFNDMAGRTRQLVDDLKRQRAALNAIIASIREGLAVLSPDGRVTLANASFRQLTGNQDPAGRYYWELLREAGFVELVKDAGGSAATVGAIVELASRTYAGSATRLPETGETVVTLHDVTDIANSEKMKRELVLNVSHELRTPLTAIRGYLETMEPEVSEPNRGYLQIVRRHTDRLTRLVQDLITLSEVEEPGLPLELELVDLCRLCADVTAVFETAARDKGLDLRLDPPAGGLTVKADRFRIEQVLINLLDNAVRYTDRGSVTLRLAERDGRALIEVSDTGPGIEEHHLPRLFERFYVVDKSRSRQSGGTGLGLSIVKHIVRLHHGDVLVDSTPGSGARFSVLLPLAS